MLSPNIIKKKTGCNPISSYFKPVTQNVFNAQLALAHAVDEESTRLLAIQKENRIREREDARLEREKVRRRLNHQQGSNNITTTATTPTTIIRDAIDQNEIVNVSNISSAAQERLQIAQLHKEKPWTHRSLIWKVVAETAITFGDDDAIRSFPEAFQGKSPTAIYQSLNGLFKNQ
jgi:hypothetical protein